MKHKILTAVVLASTALGAQVASASDGTITFNGALSASTCSINGGNPNLTVAMPNVSSTSFGSVGATSGRTAFALNLTGCTQTTGNVHAYFDTSALVNVTSGNLLNRSDAGNAKGIEMALRNASDGTKIVMGVPDASQGSKPVALVAGAGSMNYWIEYVRMGDVTPGPVASEVLYEIVYQ